MTQTDIRAGSVEQALRTLRMSGLRPLPEPTHLTASLPVLHRRAAAFAVLLTRTTGWRNVCGVHKGKNRGEVCQRPSGWRTTHEGEGPCRAHENSAARSSLRAAEVAWIMAHKFADEFECTPWEGLLTAVRKAAGKVAYCEWVLSQASHDLEIEGRRPLELTEDIESEHTTPQGRTVAVTKKMGTGVFVHPDTGEPLGGGTLRDLSFWVEKSELWIDRLARYSKAAIDAGVAERLVHQVEIEAQTLARVLGAAIAVITDDVVLSDRDRDRLESEMRSRVRAELMLMDQEHDSGQTVRVIEGSAS